MPRLHLIYLALIAPVTAVGWAAEPKEEALWAAAKKGDAAAIESLLAGGADVNARTDYGVTALLLATQRGHTDAVRALLAHRANPNLEDTFYKLTPLGLAASGKHAAIRGTSRRRGGEGRVRSGDCCDVGRCRAD